MQGYLDQSNANREAADVNRKDQRNFDYRARQDQQNVELQKSAKERESFNTMMTSDLEGLRTVLQSSRAPEQRQVVERAIEQAAQEYSAAGRRHGVPDGYVLRQFEMLKQLPTNVELADMEAQRTQSSNAQEISNKKELLKYENDLKSQKEAGAESQGIQADYSIQDLGDILLDPKNQKAIEAGSGFVGRYGDDAALAASQISEIPVVGQYLTGGKSGGISREDYEHSIDISGKIGQMVKLFQFNDKNLAVIKQLKPASNLDIQMIAQATTTLSNPAASYEDKIEGIKNLIEQDKILKGLGYGIKGGSYVPLDNQSPLTTQPSSPENQGQMGQGSNPAITTPVDQIKPKLRFNIKSIRDK
jgi:bifunctional DNA-binding transcriptional regulator/antitoxin component of YhaV-PrlF toxin-antitoxin module